MYHKIDLEGYIQMRKKFHNEIVILSIFGNAQYDTLQSVIPFCND